MAFVNGDGDSLGSVADQGYRFGWKIGVDGDGDSMAKRQLIAAVDGDEDKSDFAFDRCYRN